MSTPVDGRGASEQKEISVTRANERARGVVKGGEEIAVEGYDAAGMCAVSRCSCRLQVRRTPPRAAAVKARGFCLRPRDACISQKHRG